MLKNRTSVTSETEDFLSKVSNFPDLKQNYLVLNVALLQAAPAPLVVYLSYIEIKFFEIF